MAVPADNASPFQQSSASAQAHCSISSNDASRFGCNFNEQNCSKNNEEPPHLKSSNSSMNCRARCEQSIHWIYLKGEELSYAEHHPFCAFLDDLLCKPVTEQKIWIETTEGYLRRAFQQMGARPPGQLALTQFFSRKSQLPGPGS